MKQESMIQIENVSMKFHLSTERMDSFKEYLIKKVKRQVSYDAFWALREITFMMKPGEALALVGLNGSGKSTLLKIIAGVLKPTQGMVQVAGSIAPLIELGAGFDVDLTARENIFLNGALLGRNRAEMERHFDEIIEFSELADFIHVPVKNFSSGMVSRLAFAIATMGSPDILIVDEVLSVGDFRFQKKCEERIHKMLESGTTLLFVSHNIEQAKELCDTMVWLEKGRVKMYGSTKEVSGAYSKS